MRIVVAQIVGAAAGLTLVYEVSLAASGRSVGFADFAEAVRVLEVGFNVIVRALFHKVLSDLGQAS